MTTETSIYEYAKQGLRLSENKPALWFYGKAITYRQLFAKIDCVADNLYRLGVRQGTVVTIHLPNCPQAVMAIYAVAKLGGICNMVHPQVPSRTLVTNMAFCNSSMLITGDHFKELEKLPAGILAVCAGLADHMGFAYKMAYRLKNRSVDSSAIDFSDLEQPAEMQAPKIDQANLADCCVAYLNSSGTTGSPKIVMHNHKAFNNWVRNSQAFFRGESQAGVVSLSVLPLFHGAGMVLNMHRTLTSGGEQVLLAKWNAKQASKFIQKRRVSIITGVPYLYKSLLEQKRFLKKGTAHLTQCFVSGDHAPVELKEKFDSVVGRRALFEGYGMTEIVTACFSTSKQEDYIRASGYPLENCYAAVLTDNGSVLSVGRGEFLLSTDTMMIGYLNDEEPPVFVQHEGRLWLRTGDYGEIDEHGYLYFIDRIKNVIVRNGYNIYPNEIEEIICQIPLVRDVCVIGQKVGMAKGEDVIAFIETESEHEAEMIALVKNKCSERLPQYAFPSKIIVLRAFPRNPMKKVDRQALRRLI